MNKELLRRTLAQFVHYCAERPDDEEMIESDKNIFIYPTEAGLVETRVTDVGIFTMPAGKVYLSDDIDEIGDFQLSLPKIPREILDQTVTLFDQFIQKSSMIGSSTLEAFVQIFWNAERQEYFIHVPKQIVNSVHVDYHNDQEIIRDNVFAMEIHSHNNMRAFFSSTDDGDEKASRLYGVVGMMDEEFPHASFRMSVAGKYKYLDISDVFDMSDGLQSVGATGGKNMLVGINRNADIPSEWIDKIKIKDNELSRLLDMAKRMKNISRWVPPSSPEYEYEINLAGSGRQRNHFRATNTYENLSTTDLLALNDLERLALEKEGDVAQSLVANLEFDFLYALLYEIKEYDPSILADLVTEFASLIQELE